MGNGWSKLFTLTSPHHSQSLCDHNDWPPVKSVLLSIPLWLSPSSTLLLTLISVRGTKSDMNKGRGYKAVVLLGINRVLAYHKEKCKCMGCVLCTIPDWNTDVFMLPVVACYQILQVYMDSQQIENTLQIDARFSNLKLLDIYPNQ